MNEDMFAFLIIVVYPIGLFGFIAIGLHLINKDRKNK